MQLWVKETGQKVLIIFEGRDAAGKGGAIKRFNEHLNPRGARTVALEKPTEEEASQRYFQCYIQHLEFMRETPELERMLVNSGVHIIKFWFSVSQREQLNRFAARETDPVRRWKLSPTDLASLDAWDDYTNAKEAMFFYTHTADAPWTVVKSNDKKRARLEAIRHVLHTLPYPDKDERIVHRPDPQICGPANELAEYGEVSRGSFPRVRELAFAATAKDFLGAMREGEATVKAGLVGRADPQAVVEALAATELAVQTAVAVRDKVVEAYQEILRMPV